MSGRDGGDAYIVDMGLNDSELDRAHHWLAVETYWATGIPFDVFRRSIDNSLVFVARHADEGAVAMARVVPDRATFAWICDVFVAEPHRGQGLSHRLMQAIHAHPDLQGLRRQMLITRDAHTLYAGHGFSPLAAPDRWMELFDAEVYSRP